jgi:hypothetical protein
MNVLSDFIIRLDDSLVLKPEENIATPELKEEIEPKKKAPVKKSVPKVRSGELNINEILNLSDKKIKEIIKTLPLETVSYAMKGAGKDVRNKVEKNLGKKALNSYHELLKQLKKITSADVKKYRKEIIKQIKS